MANNLEYTLRLKDLFSKTMQGASNQVKGLDGKMNSLKSSLGGLKGAIAGAFSIGAVVSFGKAVIESLKNYEYFHASLKTMLQGNEGATKALENQLMQLAKTTPFELTEVQNATKQLMAYGFKAGEVVQTMRTLGDVSSGVGAPLGDIAYLYGTLKTSGRVTLMDLRQFAGRGIPIYETLAKRLKTTTAAINGMASDGKIAFKDIEGAFKDMTSSGGQFFNLMADQSKTVGGKLSNMADGWEQLKVNIGKSQTGIIGDTVAFFSRYLDELNKGLVRQELILNSIKTRGGKKTSYLGGSAETQANLGSVADMVQSSINKAGTSEYDANKQIEFLHNYGLIKNKQFAESIKGITDKNMLLNYYLPQQKNVMAVIEEGLSQVKAAKSVFGMKENKGMGIEGAGGVDGGKGTKSLGTGTEVTGARPQAINININELVHELNIQTNNMIEGAGRMKELVSKALLEAVNDINLIAMA